MGGVSGNRDGAVATTRAVSMCRDVPKASVSRFCMGQNLRLAGW